MAALLGALVTAPAARAQAADPFALPLESFRLPNGLQVLLAPDPRGRLVSVAVVYGVGSADEPDGLRGLAHMAEHLVAEGTKHAPDAMRVLEAAGASNFNASTTVDRTSYFETLPSERLETALWLESDRMGYAADAVTEPRVDAQRAVVANEMRDRVVDAELGALGLFANRELFPPWHPYALPWGELSDAVRVKARDVLAFLHTWYLPSNATLILAGAFDRESAMAAITRDFGPLPSAQAPQRPALALWSPPRVWLIVNASTSGDSVDILWRTPAIGTRDDAALDVLVAILAGPGNVRLAPRLLTSHLARAVSARQGSRRQGSVFGIGVTLEPGVDPVRVVDLVQEEIDALANGPSAEEMARANTIWRSSNEPLLETPWGRVGALMGTLGGPPPGPGFDWGKGRYTGVTAGDVAAVASAWLGRAHRVVSSVFATPRFPTHGTLVMRRVEGP